MLNYAQSWSTEEEKLKRKENLFAVEVNANPLTLPMKRKEIHESFPSYIARSFCAWYQLVLLG